jgi:hypothetical protein
MKTTFAAYRVGRDPEFVSLDLPDAPDFDRLDALIKPYLDGGDIAHVRVLTSVPTRMKGQATGLVIRSLFTDARGHLKTLPLNSAVSYVIYPGPIFGPAVLFDRLVWAEGHDAF